MDLPFAVRDLRPLHRAEYDRMVDSGLFEHERIELLRGHLVPMSPIGARHCAMVDRLNRLLVIALDGRATVRVQQPFAALDDSEPEPDCCAVPLGDYDDAHPTSALLVIEVAESSLVRDRSVKLAIYAESAVPEYWVVDVAARCIDVHRSPSGSTYAEVKRYAPGDAIRISAFADVEIRVRDVLR